MKRIIWLLIPLLLFLAACGSGGDGLTTANVAEPGTNNDTPTTAATAGPGEAEAAPTGTTAPADDPTAARERDWKLGDLESPAVTVIEYGDFQ